MEKWDELKIVFDKIIYQLDNGIDCDFNEYKEYYDDINEGHSDSLEMVKWTFYQMAFSIEVRKTTQYEDMERKECDFWFNEFSKSRVQ